MELHSLHRTFHHSHLGEEKHQMLNLNRRLETYLSRVKLLEEENALLAKELHGLRRSNQGASIRRKGLEEELRKARLEVDVAWRDRVHAELEVGRLTEEVQALDLQRQREARDQVKAKTKLDQSRKELEEEQRAQIWLREKVSQLEHEMRLLIQTHQQDVAHLEATLTHSRATMSPTLAQRGNQTPDLLQLGQEYSERATRARQEAAEAYEGQLARLEESLNQARSRLTQVGQEKTESQLKLQTLKNEIASAHDVRQHLEKTAAQQAVKYSQEIQQLQGHLEGLEVEKEELGQQIDSLLLENRRLLQLKMSLGLEVATYRALLDSESIRGDNSFLHQPRNIFITDAVFSPQGVKKNYQTQLSASPKTIYHSSVHSITGTGPTVITAKPVTLTKTTKISTKHANEDTKSATWETPYPKILQDEAIENFRPQEVDEKAACAEPLSSPNKQEALTEITSGGKEEVSVEPPEEGPVVESVVSYQVESGLSPEPPFNDEVSQHQFTTPNLTPYHVKMTEERSGFSDDSDKDEPFEIPADKEDMQDPPAPTDALVEKACISKEAEYVQGKTSDSETEALLEPNFEPRTSCSVSECEPEESVFNTDFSQDENILEEDAAEIRQEISCSVTGTNEMAVEDMLYPDGEEMDTWDSVIERKVDLKTDDGIKKDEEKHQHAEPEEDISAQEHEKKEIRQDVATDVQQDDNVASSIMDTQVDDDGQCAALDQEHALLPDNEEDDDEEEDSQNVSVSWRTELESDSYAQDNTIADTRPLIRYKSDEAEANTQVSHMDESESSEGEQDKKTGETGTGPWSEGKSKNFGTMEDLCEEVEGKELDEEFDLGHTDVDDRGAGHGMTLSEHAKLVNNPDTTEEIIRKLSEGHSGEEMEELTKPMVPTNVDYDEELETDRLVEQELENLATDSYSAHFAQQQVCESEEMLHLQGKSFDKMAEHEEAGKTKMEDNIVQSQTDTVADEEVQHKDQEVIVAPEKGEEEDEHCVSMVTHADVTEDHSTITPDMEEINNDPNSVSQVEVDQENLQDVAVPTEVKYVVPVEASGVSQKHVMEDVADCQELPEVPKTTEWEVLENLSEDFEIRDQNEDYEQCDNVLESAESYLHENEGSDEDVVISKEEPLGISPNVVLDENDTLVAKDATELLNTNGKDNDLQGFLSSGVKNDFWVSSLETGATYQPDNAHNEAAEQTNLNLGFTDNLVWGNFENPNVVNITSTVDINSSKALSIKKEQEQMHLEEKQVLCRNEGELVHSEESDVEGESWSSGEEPV
ncbi:nestin [Micropterus dolomieu]|uniref:nestin n=1 Tax=Micropterus dolomieu TaxID=147949 RepID=UPI001E8E15BB|nr:nestin [Micropterus dolomieu]